MRGQLQAERGAPVVVLVVIVVVLSGAIVTIFICVTLPTVGKVNLLFFTILVWCNSHTWIYFKHKAKYVKVHIKARPSVHLQLSSLFVTVSG